MSNRILVCSMRTWGELGNYTAGKALAQEIESRLPVRVDLIAVDDLVPALAETGMAMRALADEDLAADLRSTRYLALLDALESLLPPGFEGRGLGAPLSQQLVHLVTELRVRRPDLIVATKGVAARCVDAALGAAELDIPILNYVTNPGLLELPIHRTTRVAATVVPFQWARDRLVSEFGYAPERVSVGVPLSRRLPMERPSKHPDAAPEPAPGERPTAILVANRAGEAFLRVLEAIAARRPTADIVFISCGSSAVAARAREIGEDWSSGNWRVHDSLEQAIYLEELQRVLRQGPAFLVSKSGPNTVLEAARLGLPVVLLDVGLPMERWVTDLVVNNGIGRITPDPDALPALVVDWLSEPEQIRSHQSRVAQFQAAQEDDAAGDGIGDIVARLLPSSAPSPDSAEPDDARIDADTARNEVAASRPGNLDGVLSDLAARFDRLWASPVDNELIHLEDVLRQVHRDAQRPAPTTDLAGSDQRLTMLAIEGQLSRIEKLRSAIADEKQWLSGLRGGGDGD